MHNRQKVHTTEAQKAAAEREKEKKLQFYRQSINDVFNRRTRNEYDVLALKSSEGLLRANPDIVTLWNYRKDILLHLNPSKEIINDELYLTEKCLQVNPKSYSAWYHRNWVLDNIDSSADWNKELSLCTKYLKMDERNFHCWDYRQIVASKCQEPHENELQFTMEMIESNFSNYSAWHYRSKLFSAAGKDEESTKISELSLVESAAFTDPSDQSAWIYQRWLIGKLEPSKYIYKVSQIKNKIYLVLNKSLPNNYKIKGLGNNNWEQLDPKIWYTNVNNLDINSVEIIDETNQVIDGILMDNIRQDIFQLNISEQLRLVLNAQVDSLRQLLSMEPESKWALLTYVLLLHTLKLNNYIENCLKNIKLLKVIDTLRKNYYNDLESRYQIEYWIANNNNTDTVHLKGLGLTAFYHMHMFLFHKNIDLSDNNLSNSNLSHLKYLLMCKNLSLKNCQLINLNNFPALPSLEVLDLRENQIQETSCKELTKCESLKTIILDNNQIILQKTLHSITQFINIEIV
ncbi:Leucine-rich repeat domain, L domain-like,Protein prenyltransferase, alpha subunit [Cinara cedri]|uniref:Geranylgeranyl transferase type-2 subunit alpha n=1 Tax=Cinara cedri TaxID=506608 RepID=A0A5E4MDW7_9HEMI|nr:Leucine-rich repeat domain, L domain-like,Protein prenyltransferase, alpha subunit [Cinara cedri]